jgi:hypothetical protein
MSHGHGPAGVVKRARTQAQDAMGWCLAMRDLDFELNLDVGKMEPGRGFRLTVARVINDIPITVAAKPRPLTYLDSIIPRGSNRMERT